MSENRFSFNVNVNIDSPTAAIWYKKYSGGADVSCVENYSREVVLDDNQKAEFEKIAHELLEDNVELVYSDDPAGAGHAESDGQTINLDSVYSVGQGLLSMATGFQPSLPSSLTPEIAFLGGLVHEAEHITQVRTKGAKIDNFDVRVRQDLESDGEYAKIQFFRGQDGGNEIAEAFLNIRALNALNEGVILEQVNPLGAVMGKDHDVSLAIRHYERTKEVLDFDDLVEAYRGLSEKMSDLISEKNAGITGRTEYQNLLKGIVDDFSSRLEAGIKKLPLTERQELMTKLNIGTENDLGKELDKRIESAVIDDNEFNAYLFGSVYNPAFLLTAMENVVAAKDLSETESMMIANAIESVRSLGYKPLSDLSENADIVVKTVNEDKGRVFSILSSALDDVIPKAAWIIELGGPSLEEVTMSGEANVSRVVSLKTF